MNRPGVCGAARALPPAALSEGGGNSAASRLRLPFAPWRRPQKNRNGKSARTYRGARENLSWTSQAPKIAQCGRIGPARKTVDAVELAA